MASEVLEREGKSYWGMGARECDSCKLAPALLFCRADSAFLCGTCDAKVHGANKLASRHERVWMCEVCEQAPAAVTCKADAAALCVTCDADIHSANPLARRHERFPVVPFFHSPTEPNPNTRKHDLLRKSSDDVDDDEDDEHDGDAEAEAASWLLPPKAVPIGGGVEHEVKPAVVDPYFFADVDPYLDLDYAAAMDPRFHQTDSVVPVQQQNRGAAPQIHHPAPFFTAAGSYDIDFTASKPSYSYAASLSHSVSSSEVGVVPDGGAMTDISNPYGGCCVGTQPVAAAAMGMDREARVMRYREKRKNRRFEKTIRYASRKAYAETRPRIKGRFAKRTELDGDADVMFSSPVVAIDSGYGVVPSF